MRFRKHIQLAQVPPGSSGLDIGSCNGNPSKYLTRDMEHQGATFGPECGALGIVEWGGTNFYPPMPAPWWMLARSVAYKFVKTSAPDGGSGRSRASSHWRSWPS